jgi:hypothetical protein
MKLLLNNKEIARFLIELIDVYNSCKNIELNEEHTASTITWIIDKKKEPRFNLEKHRDKIKQKIRQSVSKDMRAYMASVNSKISNHHDFYYKNIHKHIEYFIKTLDEDKIIAAYKVHHKKNFIKTVGFQIDSDAVMMRRINFNSVEENCLLRNTIGNETLLVSKIDNKYPFWFIDSGYTNFIESNKKWHRLVQNHLHYNQYFDAPADRLKNFTSFPQPWKEEGDRIMVVEPGPFAASIFHADPKLWRYQIESELRKYTDKPIVFRTKTNKKTRQSLYKTLCNEDFYCTVSINSNSAVESIWAGIPAITLDKHISNPVTVNSLDQVNNLYRGPLGNWLAWLSYCQFTYDELMDGTAYSIIKKYHG